MSPLTSRRFWTLVLDAIVSSITFAIATYGTPQYQAVAVFAIATYQPVFIYLINQYTKDDMATNAALIASGDHPLQQAAKLTTEAVGPAVFTVTSPPGTATLTTAPTFSAINNPDRFVPSDPGVTAFPGCRPPVPPSYDPSHSLDYPLPPALPTDNPVPPVAPADQAPTLPV